MKKYTVTLHWPKFAIMTYTEAVDEEKAELNAAEFVKTMFGFDLTGYMAVECQESVDA